MLAETHRRGRVAEPEEILVLLCCLLGDRTEAEARTLPLSGAGVGAESTPALWDAVCEELAERSRGPELGPEAVSVSMTFEQAAGVMASQLPGPALDVG